MRSGGASMDIPKVNILCGILPHLVKLELIGDLNIRYSTEAQEMLLDCLAHNTTIKQLTLELFGTPSVSRLARMMLEQNTSFESCAFVRQQRTDEDDSLTLLQSLLHGMCANQSIRRLSLQRWDLPAWNKIEWRDTMDGCWASQNISLRILHLEHNQYLHSGTSFVRGMCSLFPGIAAVSFIVDFQSQQYESPARVAELVKVMDQGTNLQAIMAVVCANLDCQTIPVFLDALRRNTSLIRIRLYVLKVNEKDWQEGLLKILVDDNVTLGSFNFVHHWGKKVRLDEKIQFFLNLNRWGRKFVRHTAASKKALVELLGKVLDAPQNQFDPLEDQTYLVEAKFNVLYGLLREQPGLWM